MWFNGEGEVGVDVRDVFGGGVVKEDMIDKGGSTYTPLSVDLIELDATVDV